MKLQQKCKQNTILKLACFMQILTEVRPAQFLLHLARRVPSEMKITKITRVLILERPGGMRGGAGGRFKGG